MATYTLQEYGEQMDAFLKGWPEAVNRAGLVATQNLHTNTKFRWFTGSTKDVKGNTRTYNSQKWIEQRKAKGLQVNVVDMVYEGDLKRSIGIAESKNTYDIITKGNINIEKIEKADIAFEKATGSPVFEASKKEEKRLREDFDEEINKYINKFFD